jgi:hypothetical protein
MNDLLFLATKNLQAHGFSRAISRFALANGVATLFSGRDASSRLVKVHRAKFVSRIIVV